jgi:hypothetical protein
MTLVTDARHGHSTQLIMKLILHRAIDAGIMLIALPLLASMVLLPPVAFVSETIDLARMRERTVGQVLDVSIVNGRHGTTRTRVLYAFRARGRRIVSERYLPGFLGNWGFSGGDSVANDFRVGQPVIVYHRADDPSGCALEYGWCPGSVGLMLILVGGAAVALARCQAQPRKGAFLLESIGVASIVYAFGVLFLGPTVVRVRDLHWHLLVWCGALGVAAIYAAMRRRSGDPITEPLAEANAECVPNHVSRDPAM